MTNFDCLGSLCWKMPGHIRRLFIEKIFEIRPSFQYEYRSQDTWRIESNYIVEKSYVYEPDNILKESGYFQIRTPVITSHVIFAPVILTRNDVRKFDGPEGPYYIVIARNRLAGSQTIQDDIHEYINNEKKPMTRIENAVFPVYFAFEPYVYIG